MRQTLLEYFFENASNTDDTAFSHRPKLRRKSWTYAAIARASFQFARELRSRGIDHGDRIVIIGKNSPEWIVAFYGAMLLGVIVVPLDVTVTAFAELPAVTTVCFTAPNKFIPGPAPLVKTVVTPVPEKLGVAPLTSLQVTIKA